ncbi:MAG: hypothetical protein IJ091_00465 [Oscillospiraceae bacterium]|nr:hypothetical protein [Oscillospiraceae bacterium]
MSRYKRADEIGLNEEQTEAVAYHENEQGGHMTNMKYTLLRDLPSFRVYMGWYDLQKGLLKFLSEREFLILSYSISTQNDCLVCGTFFRKILIEKGEDLENLQLSDREQVLWDLGRAFVVDFHHIPEDVYVRLDEIFSETEVIQILAFAGQMAATNMFVTSAKVDLDEVLLNYRKKEKYNG